MSMELISLGVSALTGFLFKMWANKQQDEQQRYMQMLGRTEAIDNSQDRASNRNGIWIRRFIVLVMMSILFVIATGIGVEPTNIIEKVSDTQYLFGLISFPNKAIVHEITGGMYDETIKVSILSIIGYYFGNSTASR